MPWSGIRNKCNRTVESRMMSLVKSAEPGGLHFDSQTIVSLSDKISDSLQITNDRCLGHPEIPLQRHHAGAQQFTNLSPRSSGGQEQL